MIFSALNPLKICVLSLVVRHLTTTFFSKDVIAKRIEMCSDYLKLGGRAHMSCSKVQFWFWIKAVSASTKSVAFEASEGNEQEREKAMLDQE